MPNANQQRIIDEHLKALSYSDGEGILSCQKRAMVENCGCLLIGFGGTGLDAMENANNLLKRSLDEEEYSRNVAILAVDSASDAFKKTVVDSDGNLQEVDRFEPTHEKCFLPFDQANYLMEHPTPSMGEWINPSLKRIVHFSGTGANSIRQGGRVLLTQSEAVSLLRSKVINCVNNIMTGKPVSYRLNVFLFFGIAGGTGSGTIIDGSYLVRQFVYEAMPALEDNNRSKFCGYIMLPPAGAQVASNHHRNGYAALKEVDHYMTIEKRHETFSNQYDGYSISTQKNIFDICIVLDGRINGVFTSNPRAAAFETASSSLLDAITTVPVAPGVGGGTQSIDEYMDNTAAITLERVKNEGYQKAVRDANYVYAILGSAQALIPIDLMKSYVMHQVFRRMKQQFDNCSNVTEAEAKQFLSSCNALGTTDFDRTRDKLYRELIRRLRNPNQGPSYLVNLLDEAARIEANWDTFNPVNKAARLQTADRLSKWLRACNNNVYKIYTSVIEKMAEYLKEAANILTDTTERKTMTHSTFSWMLIDFDSKADSKNQFVKQYLDSLVSKGRVANLIQSFQNELADNIQEWTGLSSSNGAPIAFCPEKRLRHFIDRNISVIVTATVEDYLVKFYTQNSNAKATDANGNVVEGSPEDKALTEAAKRIVDDMFTGMAKAKPKVQVRDNASFMSLNRYSQKIMMYVPQCAPHLFDKISKQLKANGLANSVALYKSYSSDAISCYWRYDGIPAYQIDWVLDGEKAYEKEINGEAIGLHMSETSGSSQWRNFPNLCNRAKWNDIENAYYQEREAFLARSAEEAISDAYRLGIATEHLIPGTHINACFMKLPTSEYSVDAALLNNMDNQYLNQQSYENARQTVLSQAQVLANNLFGILNIAQNVILTLPTVQSGDPTLIDTIQTALNIPATEREIEIGDSLDARVPGPNDAIPANWTKDLSAKLLRMRVEMLYRVRGTILVLQELCKLIDEHNQAAAQTISAATDIDDFKLLCSGDRIIFMEVEDKNEDDEDDIFYRWVYLDSNGTEHILVELDPTDDLQVTAKHFYAFKAYNRLDAKIKDELVSYIKKSKKDFLNIKKFKLPQLQNALNELLKQRSATGWAPENIVIGSNEYFTYVPMAIGSASFGSKVPNAEEIRDFYRNF